MSRIVVAISASVFVWVCVGADRSKPEEFWQQHVSEERFQGIVEQAA